jgi:hypothetical protein
MLGEEPGVYSRKTMESPCQFHGIKMNCVTEKFSWQTGLRAERLEGEVIEQFRSQKMRARKGDGKREKERRHKIRWQV